MQQSTQYCAVFVLGLSAMALGACDSDAEQPDTQRSATVLTTVADVLEAKAADGVLVLDVSSEDTIFEFELGDDPAVWNDVFVVDGDERLSFAEVAAGIAEGTGIDVWARGSFQWTVDAENFGTLTNREIEQLEQVGSLQGSETVAPRLSGYPDYAIYECIGGTWVICYPDV
ncbi:MAG: hypothetical protein K0V04_15200 [Deltaproteobacteria bacterium]|nr:hypothetical protein [Deltaproteobacteria bacterium]